MRIGSVQAAIRARRRSSRVDGRHGGLLSRRHPASTTSTTALTPRMCKDASAASVERISASVWPGTGANPASHVRAVQVTCSAGCLRIVLKVGRPGEAAA
jgi:hypothetical protein